MRSKISTWLRKRKVKRFVFELPGDLRQRYGRLDAFTRGQIGTTLDELAYPEDYRGYAYVLFMELQDAAEVIGSAEVAELMAQELSEWFFSGSRDIRPRWENKTFTDRSGHSLHGGGGGFEGDGGGD